MLDSIIDCLDGLCFIDPNQLNWLKSIKPNHWKPSEEQMEALFEAKLASIKIENIFLDYYMKTLKNCNYVEKDI